MVFQERQKDSFVTEPHSGIIGNAINSNNMLEMTTKDPTESQKVIADILNDDRNCIDPFIC